MTSCGASRGWWASRSTPSSCGTRPGWPARSTSRTPSGEPRSHATYATCFGGCGQTQGRPPLPTGATSGRASATCIASRWRAPCWGPSRSSIARSIGRTRSRRAGRSAPTTACWRGSGTCGRPTSAAAPAIFSRPGARARCTSSRSPRTIAARRAPSGFAAPRARWSPAAPSAGPITGRRRCCRRRRGSTGPAWSRCPTACRSCSCRARSFRP